MGMISPNQYQPQNKRAYRYSARPVFMGMISPNQYQPQNKRAYRYSSKPVHGYDISQSISATKQ